MDKDTLLRRQVHNEVLSQFDSKLKEARRGKIQAEEELESAAERWRSERRRLNLEIDRLESALAAAKEKPSRKSDDAKATGIDPVEVAKMRAAADERLSKASKDWDTERGQLTREIDRLEKAIADAIERSNNPLRSTLPFKQQLEAQLDEALRAKQQIEQEFRRTQGEWAQEKLKLTGEMVRLRRSPAEPIEPKAANKTSTAKGRATGDSESGVEDDSRFKTEREQLQKENQKPRESLDQVQNRAKAYAQKIEEYETRLSEMTQMKGVAEKELRTALDESKHQQQRLSADDSQSKTEREQQEKEIQRLRESLDQVQNRAKTDAQKIEEYETRLSEATQMKTAAEKELRAGRDEWKVQQQQLSSEINRLQSSLKESVSVSDAPEAPQHVQEQIEHLEAQLAEAVLSKTRLEDQVGAAKIQWLEERARQQTRIKQLETTLSETRERMSTEIVDQLRKQYDEKLEEIIQEKTRLSKELQTASASLEAERTRFTAEIAKSKKTGKTNPTETDALNELVATELTRIESMVAQLTALIDDPKTELSTVIRKNVEKAELDAYLKGILFSLGKGRGLK